MEDLATVTVDGRPLRVPTGTLLWEACKAHGIEIPVFCYHTKLGPVGACRTCLVEQEGVTKGPITACSTPVTEGMVIRTKSATVEKAQRGIFEFLLANHPLDCPICDRGGECPLQDQTFAWGPGTSRYVEPKRHHVKPIILGPTIALDRERCVLCWRCVRFCDEIAEDKSIILLDRGEHSMVGTFHDVPYVSNFSGNVIELCPVGALTSRKQRFSFRPWELQNRPSICPHCAMGCNINMSVRKNDEVIRFLSRDNPEVDNSWLCDRGRFNFEFINSAERLKSPMIRREEGFVQVSWDEALGFVAERLQRIVEDTGPQSIIGAVSPCLTNEDLFVFRRFMRDTIGTEHLDHFPRPDLALSAEQAAIQVGLARTATTISSLNAAKTIVLLGANPSDREPVLELRIREAINRQSAQLVAIQAQDTALTSKAAAVIRYQPSGFAAMARKLAGIVGGSPSASNADEGDLAALVAKYFGDGPIVLLYDDSFPDIQDKADALEAVAGLVATLGTRLSLGTIPMLDACNSMGARDQGIFPGAPWAPSVLRMLTDGPDRVRAAMLLGTNIVRDAGTDMAAQLSALELVVVHELAMTETVRHAHVVLPAASFAEKTGTFTNTEGRLQLLTPTVPSPGIARADWEILTDLSQYFERPLPYNLPHQVWEDIRRHVPSYSGVAYEDIGPRGVRPEAMQLV